MAIWVEENRILAAVSLDRGSALALRRAHDLSRALELELCVVHVVTTPPSPAASRAVLDFPSRLARTRMAKVAVQEWSLFELGIALPSRCIHIRFGLPEDQLTRVSRQLRAGLLVVGGRVAPHSPSPGQLTRRIISRAKCPVFVAGPVRDGRSMVVATDLVGPTVPVVRVAWDFARRLARRLTVVHNLESVVPAATGAPLDVLDPDSAARLDTLGLVIQALDDVDATVTHDSTAVEGILRVARARDVDLVVVGVRPRAGLTTENVLAQARRSVLAVPLPS